MWKRKCIEENFVIFSLSRLCSFVCGFTDIEKWIGGYFFKKHNLKRIGMLEPSLYCLFPENWFPFLYACVLIKYTFGSGFLLVLNFLMNIVSFPGLINIGIKKVFSRACL